MPNLANETGLFVVSDDVLSMLLMFLWSLLTFIYVIDIIYIHLEA